MIGSPGRHYLRAAFEALEVRRYGGAFNAVAAEYDRHRPGYPDALIDRAYEVARLAPGSPALEIARAQGS